MSRIALGIEYDGSSFKGWQRQLNLPSVQETLEKALSQVATKKIDTICAGRTDTGVHATGQVVHFDSEVQRSERGWVLGTNTVMPHSVRVLWAREVPAHFNARRSALRRRYRYVIYNHPLRPSLLRNYVCWHYRKLDVQKMIEASRCWLGEHDYSSFRASGCQSLSPVRSIYSIQITRVGDQVILDFVANAYLHHMIRNMAGVLMSIGSGRAPISWAKEILEAKDRCKGGVTASPLGLYLVQVQYPEAFGLPEFEVGPWFLKMNEDP